VITGAARGGFTVRASADGFQEQAVGVTLTADLLRDFQLQPAGPRRKFGPGQYRVNSEIAPGRYYSDPNGDGCYWERQRGFGGTTGDIIANDFVGYDPGQLIVDILPSDLAFDTDADCGVWYDTPRAGAQTGISPGMWLVGPQLAPGIYRASTNAGCYWERLRNFQGASGSVIANDFVSGGGARTVEIRRADVGFNTDQDCGQWTRSSGISAEETEITAPPAVAQTDWEIEQNRERQRQQSGSR
jgi:hypothetical protein